MTGSLRPPTARGWTSTFAAAGAALGPLVLVVGVDPGAVPSALLDGVIAAAKGTPLLMGRAKEVFPSTVWSGPDFALAVGMVLLYCLAAMACSGASSALRWRQAFTVYGLAYLPLAITGLFMIYFRALVEGGAQLIPLLLTAFGLIQLTDPARLTPELGTLRLLIYPGILAGMAFSLVALASLQRQHRLSGPGLLGHRLLLLLTTAVFLILL